MTIPLSDFVMTTEESKVADAFEAKVDALFEDEHYVQYAVTDDNDNLIELASKAADGKCMFTRYASNLYGGHLSETYVSRIIYFPQWKDVCLFAEEAIIKTNDTHHIYLEGIKYKMTNPTNGISVYEFQMGS